MTRQEWTLRHRACRCLMRGNAVRGEVINRAWLGCISDYADTQCALWEIGVHLEDEPDDTAGVLALCGHCAERWAALAAGRVESNHCKLIDT